MNEQPELSIQDSPSAAAPAGSEHAPRNPDHAPTVDLSNISDPDAIFLLGLLAARPDWTTAAQITTAVKMEKGWDWNDRLIRRLAALAAPEIISGDSGYKLGILASAEEIRHFVLRMESQIGKEQSRTRATRERFPAAFFRS